MLPLNIIPRLRAPVTMGAVLAAFAWSAALADHCVHNGGPGTYTCTTIESQVQNTQWLVSGKKSSMCYCVSTSCPPLEVDGLSMTWTDYKCGATQNGNQLDCDGRFDETPGQSGELGGHHGEEALQPGHKHYLRVCLCAYSDHTMFICDLPLPEDYVICLQGEVTHGVVVIHTDRQCTGGGGDCTIEGCTDECDE